MRKLLAIRVNVQCLLNSSESSGSKVVFLAGVKGPVTDRSEMPIDPRMLILSIE